MTYLRIDEKSNLIQIKFNNPLESEITKSQTYSINNIDKAEKEANNWDIFFYEKHRYLIPKGISINKSRKNFQIRIKIKNEYKYVGSFKRLQDAKKSRKSIIDSLV